MNSITRVCIKCHKAKLLYNFKKCGIDKKYYSRTCQECMAYKNREYQMQYETRNMEHRKLLHKEWYRRNRGKRIALYNSKPCKAKEKVRTALRNGVLIKPISCSQCGEIRILNAHHPDYNKPLQVIWLCCPCHRTLHESQRKEIEWTKKISLTT
jgi:hypothetical protein